MSNEKKGPVFAPPGWKRSDTPYSAFFCMPGHGDQRVVPFTFHGGTTSDEEVYFFFGKNEGMVPAIGLCENEAEFKRAITLFPVMKMPLEMARHFHEWFGQLIEKAEDPNASREVKHTFASPEHNDPQDIQ